MSQEGNDRADDWREWKRWFRLSTAAIAALAVVWGSITAVWAQFELPAPLLLTARYERDQRKTEERLDALGEAVNGLSTMLNRFAKKTAAAELREIERQIVENQGKPDLVRLLQKQRDAIMTEQTGIDSEFRRMP